MALVWYLCNLKERSSGFIKEPSVKRTGQLGLRPVDSHSARLCAQSAVSPSSLSIWYGRLRFSRRTKTRKVVQHSDYSSVPYTSLFFTDSLLVWFFTSFSEVLQIHPSGTAFPLSKTPSSSPLSSLYVSWIPSSPCILWHSNVTDSWAFISVQHLHTPLVSAWQSCLERSKLGLTAKDKSQNKDSTSLLLAWK